MLPKDRDRLIELLVFNDFLNEWVKDPDTEIKLDIKKVNTIRTNVKLLMENYAKEEGKAAFDIILDETAKLNFAFLPRDKDIKIPDSLEFNILKSAANKVVENITDCELCNKNNHKYCELFTLKKMLNFKQYNNGKRCCPFKNTIDNIFDIKDL